MKRFASLLICCLATAFVYAQESLNYNPKYKKATTEKESFAQNDSAIQNQRLNYKTSGRNLRRSYGLTKRLQSGSEFKLAAPSGLNVRIAKGLINQQQTESDSLSIAPKEGEEISGQKEEK